MTTPPAARPRLRDRRYPLPGDGSSLRVTRRGLFFHYGDVVDDPASPITSRSPVGLNAAGLARMRAWVDALFSDAEQVRRLSRRNRMSAGYSRSSGGVTFARSYTPEDIARWAEALLLILRDPAHLTSRPAGGEEHAA